MTDYHIFITTEKKQPYIKAYLFQCAAPQTAKAGPLPQ